MKGSEAFDVRVAVRPLATVMTGVVEVLGPLSRRTSAPLLRRARAGLRAPETDPLLRLSGFRSGKHEVPEFLGPDLTIGPSSCLDEDLQRLRAIPERTIRADLADFLAVDDPTDQALRWADDPDRELTRLCSALWSFWRAVGPVLYPDLERRLRREVQRLKVLAESTDPVLVLDNFGARLRSRGDYAAYRSWYPAADPPAGKIVLLPMVAAPATVSYTRGGTGRRCVAHFIGAASGSLALIDRPCRTGHDPLCRLVGETRGRLLRELSDLPATTTDLAEILVVTPPTVSHHLHVLASAGVVEPHRVGSEVFYHLSARGRALVRLWH